MSEREGETAAVSCQGITKWFGEGDARTQALRGIDLEIKLGEMTMVVGPSGCGKTTLISVIAGLLDATEGTMEVLGVTASELKAEEQILFRRKNLGFVFQAFNLLPALSAAENAAMPLFVAGQDWNASVEQAGSLLTELGLSDRLNSLPKKLSGGQQQRVALARALVHQPRMLICDEPTSALDAKTGQKVMELLSAAAVRSDRAVIVVTHDSRVYEFADRIVSMEDGRVVSTEQGESNPRRHFEDGPLQELAESIRVQGVLSPLLVRPLTEQSFEIVAGARRFRAAHLAEAEAVPVRIVNLSDAEALEAQLIENLQRRDVHPLEEAQGFRALLNLEEPRYSVEQIAAKVGKPPSYVAQRLRLTELVEPVVEAFYAEAIGVGHALLLAKLQPAQQEQALKECFREEWAGGSNKQKRILLPVKHLHHFIEHSLMLLLAQAPFSREDAALVPSAGACVDCPKRTGNNRLLFSDIKHDACTDPACYSVKVEAYVQITLAAKPEMVRISTSYGQQPEGATALPRTKYVAINPEKPTSPQQAKWPEYKTCRFTKDALITDGLDKGEARKVCANPECPIHHPKNATNRQNETWKAEQEKHRRDEAIATTAGLRVLAAIAEAVPVRLMKRDLLVTVERLLPLLDDRRLEIIGRGRSIRAKKEENIGKLLSAFAKKADEGTLGRLLIETAILLSVRSGMTAEQALTAAAQTYKVDAEAISRRVKHEFAMRDKNKKMAEPETKALGQKRVA